MARQEFYIEDEVCQHAKSLGWRHRKMQFIGRRGCPDRWFTRAPGQLVIIEFKDPDGALSYHQKKEVGWLRDNGFDVHVVDTIEQGRAIFEALGLPPTKQDAPRKSS